MSSQENDSVRTREAFEVLGCPHNKTVVNHLTSDIDTSEGRENVAEGRERQNGQNQTEADVVTVT